MDAILPSQPSTYWQLIRCSFTLYRISFSKMILLFSALLTLVIFLPRLLSDFTGEDFFLTLILTPSSPHYLWAIIADLSAFVFFIGIVWHMHCVIRRIHEPMTEDIAIGVKKMINAFIASFLQFAIVMIISVIMHELLAFLYRHHLLLVNDSIGILLVTMLFIGQLLLIIYVYTLFIFLLPLIAVENKGILSALGKSVWLVWNHWWRTFSVQLTPWLWYAILLVTLRFGLHIDIHLYFLAQKPHAWWFTLLNMAIFILFVPWVAALLLVQLRDLELRKTLSQR